MMGSVSLIMIAFALGGLMEKIGLISALLEGVMKGIRSKAVLLRRPSAQASASILQPANSIYQY